MIPNEIGMSDKQFKGYVRLLLTSLKEVAKLLKSGNQDDAAAKLKELTDNLQQTIED